ncbi:hypothetical protein [Myroides odoratimimus]|uniref:Uncharacterized protein n=1 Tax=Myroides odoratimimus CIP 101113 TaxID=883154 RepID=A0AAV3F514_9FLAO|nr:hypothetical protein [Myroides odoratimimus]EHO13828.1 hypothetical protein HMPREF9715_00902 [Myroides odoratimimus CIP 101113]
MNIDFEKLKEILEKKKGRGLNRTFLHLRLAKDQIHQLEAEGYKIETVTRGSEVYQSIKFK